MLTKGEGMRLILLCLAALLAQSANAVVMYDVVDLGPGKATGISDNGYIIGENKQLWRMKDGVKQSFALTVDYTFRGKVNSSGQMVGCWSGSPGIPTGYFYCDGGNVSQWSGQMSDFISINSQGMAVGSELSGASYTISNGVRTRLPNDFYALAINDSGVIAGSNLGGSQLRIYANGVLSAYPYPSSTLGYPIDMANSGHIAGWYWKDNKREWFIYDGQGFEKPTEGIQNKPSNLMLNGMNESDVLVGTDTNAYDGYVYRDGALIDLNSVIDPASGWHISEAYDVNSSGQIVGVANGHAVLLNPVLSEPVKLKGDANGDGKVNFDDYLVLESSFGGAPRAGANADFDGNGTVDFDDYLILEANFGAGSTIPEPTTMTLLGLSLLAILQKKTRR